MKKIQKPYHKLQHFGTNPQFSWTVSKTLLSSVDTIRTIERFQKPLTNTWYQKGKYIIKTFQITSTVNHNLSNQDTIIAYWPRPSLSVTWPLFSNHKLVPREKTNILTINNSSATLRGYIYQVKDSLGNSLGWWPVDTAHASTSSNPGYWAEYSVLTRNYAATFPPPVTVGIDKKITGLLNVNVYPNPSNGYQSLEIETNKVCNLTIELYDVMGRKIKTVYSGKSEPSMTVINQDVSGLANSLYIYNINIDGKITSRKFIKQ